MKRLFDSEFTEEFAEGASRAFWVSAWADDQEGRGKRLGGELMHQAPDTPLSAWVAAGELIALLEVANKVPVEALAERADKVDGDCVDATEFGHYMAMMALGSGVSWFDDHEKFDFKSVNMEYDFYDD